MVHFSASLHVKVNHFFFSASLFLLRVTTRINSDTPRSARKSTIDNSRPPSFSKVVKRVQKTSQEQLIEEAAEKERKQQAAQEAYQA